MTRTKQYYGLLLEYLLMFGPLWLQIVDRDAAHKHVALSRLWRRHSLFYLILLERRRGFFWINFESQSKLLSKICFVDREIDCSTLNPTFLKASPECLFSFPSQLTMFRVPVSSCNLSFHICMSSTQFRPHSASLWCFAHCHMVPCLRDEGRASLFCPSVP